MAKSLVIEQGNESVAISKILTVEPQLFIAIHCDINVWPIFTDIHEFASDNSVTSDAIVHIDDAITWTRNWVSMALMNSSSEK